MTSQQKITAARQSALPYFDPARAGELTAGLAQDAARHDLEGSFPNGAIALLHKAGVLTATVDPAHGGQGLDLPEAARLLVALGRGDPSAALIALMNMQFHRGQRPGDPRSLAPHLYRRILRESAEKPTLINAFRAEPDLGAPARGGLPQTRARYSAEGWVISGRKMFCTGSTGLSYHLPWAVTDEAVPRVAEFLIPADAPGITIVPVWDHLGLRATQSHDVIYQDVLIPHDHIVGAEVITPETRQDNRAVAPVVLLIQALYLGVARAAQEAFEAFAHARVPSALGRPIATTERIRSIAGEIELQILQAELLLTHAAQAMQDGEERAFSDVIAVKTAISTRLIEAVQIAVEAIGNPGLSRGNPLERHLRDILCSRIHSPQRDSVLLTLGSARLAASAPGP